jgi:hypothetical protein
MLLDRRGGAFICAMLASALFLLAGCGGKSSSAGNPSASSSSTSSGTTSASTGASGTSSPPLSKQFIAQADPICRKANSLLARSSAKGKKAPELAEAVVVNETIERKTAAALAKLSPPPALASGWAKMLGYRRALANELGTLAAAVKREDSSAVPALTRSKKKLHRDLSQLARSAGFKYCAKIG